MSSLLIHKFISEGRITHTHTQKQQSNWDLNKTGEELKKKKKNEKHPQASTKNAIRARANGPAGSDDAGTKCDGYASAKNCATMADSVMISPLYDSEGTRPRGLTCRYSGVRGLERSMISSS